MTAKSPWDLLHEHGHAGLQRLVRDLNRLYARKAALHGDTEPHGFPLDRRR